MTKRRSLSKTIEDLEGTAADIGSDVRDRLEDELHRIEDTIEKLKPHIEDIKSKMHDGFNDGKEKLEKEIEKNPLAAIGIVALIFFILGFLLSGRRRD